MPGTPYSEAVTYLFGLQRHGIKLGLEAMQALLHALDCPHRRFQSLHIGGTNGKGSTAALAASILQAAGLRIGLYTSPHLIDFRERIRVNGIMIAEEDVSELTGLIRRQCPDEVSPTFFEFTTAMALLHFARSSVDLAVLEVGLGGRYDATNVVTPLASCITTVAMDHEEYLGRDLRSISFEKAGIIKRRVPVLVGALEPESRAVVENIAREQDAPMLELGVDFRVDGEGPSACSYHSRHRAIHALSCPLLGRHQLDNLACAIAAVEAVHLQGGPVGDEAIRRGVAVVDWAGRLEVVNDRPRVILDGAHNPAGASVVAEYISCFRRRYRPARVWLVLGMMRDKDHAGFLRALLPEVDEVILTVPKLPRAASTEALRACLPADGPRVRSEPIVSEAILMARRLADADDLICVTGSLMLVGEVKAFLQGVPMSPLRG